MRDMLGKSRGSTPDRVTMVAEYLRAIRGPEGLSPPFLLVGGAHVADPFLDIADSPLHIAGFSLGAYSQD